jgi:hypothetical protein
MMIPLGRRRLSISLVASGQSSGSAAPLASAESDAELAHLSNPRDAVRERAEQDVSRILYAGPPVR